MHAPNHHRLQQWPGKVAVPPHHVCALLSTKTAVSVNASLQMTGDSRGTRIGPVEVGTKAAYF